MGHPVAEDRNIMLVETDLQQLGTAKILLENPGLAARLTHLLGSPIEKGLELLPEQVSHKLHKATRTALMKAADLAMLTLEDSPGVEASRTWHKLGAALSGGAGGFFGLPGLAVELPVSTVIILRSIADIARSEGELLSNAEGKLACLEVFALGGRSANDDGAESGYFAVRTLLAKSLTDATEFIALHGVSKDATPAILRLVEAIASRFGIQVSEKFAAQSLPVIGAAGGAVINTMFIDHFQDMARGHFIVRRLERLYGKAVVREAYESLPSTAQ